MEIWKMLKNLKIQLIANKAKNIGNLFYDTIEKKTLKENATERKRFQFSYDTERKPLTVILKSSTDFSRQKTYKLYA